MDTVKPHSGLDRAASDWVVRLTSGTSSAEDIRAARAWCAQSPQHRRAFERARTLWRDVARVRGRRAPISSPRKLAYAATMLLALSSGWLGLRLDWFADYRAPLSEARRIDLGDGSTVLLDRGAAIDVDYGEHRRSLTLRHGQALFEVRHDPTRPFVVRGGNIDATAIGTVYSVRVDGDVGEVVVKQGVVEVRDYAGNAARVPAGEHVLYRENKKALKPEAVNIDVNLAWERGILIFERTPLVEVVRQLNRYRHGKVFIASDRLNDLPVSGVFRLDDLDEALATLPQALPLKLTRVTNYAVVLY